jgi:hypothetical protein
VDGAVAAGTAVAQLYEPGELARHPLLLVSSHVKARRTAGQAESSAGTPFSSEHTPACATRQTDGGHGFNGRRRGRPAAGAPRVVGGGRVAVQPAVHRSALRPGGFQSREIQRVQRWKLASSFLKKN